MPAAVSPGVHPTVEHDDLDDIFNYDAGIDATFNQAGQEWNAQNNTNNTNANLQSGDQPVDIDEEVKVTKKRRPIAKLDEERLLSQQGIPKLRKIARNQLKIKGKGHEFSDMARLLNTYQLWLDDLFPKAKFIDGVSMIEKLGHKKRIQMMRKEWIDEGKPKPPRDEDEDDFVIPEENPGASQPQSNQSTENQNGEGQQVEQGQSALSNGDQASSANNAQPTHDSEEPDEDELDALLAEGATTANDHRSNNAHTSNDNDPDEDELDALMAEDAQATSAQKSLFGGPTTSTSVTRQPADDFADDEEAMADMDW